MTSTLPAPEYLSDVELATYLTIAGRVEEKRRYVWKRFARPDQIRPRGKWAVWFLLGGRGSGKTRTGSETMREWSEERPAQQMAVVAKSHREVLNICFEAPRAGLIKVVPPWEITKYLRGAGSVELTMTNGTVLRAFSAQDPEALRGYAFDKVWLDEYAAYPWRTAQLVYDMAWFCMRESVAPRMVITSTPKPLPHIKKLIDRAQRQPHRVKLTRSKTSDNRANLSAEALAELDEMYAGTRLGRQELDAEMLEDVEGALWQLAWIERGRVLEAPDLIRRFVAVDPADTVSATSDETGLIVAGLGVDGDAYVLDDRSGKFAGLDAAYRAWQAWADWGCELLLIEGASLWALDILRLAWRELQKQGVLPPGDPPIKVVQPFASKQMRAAPVAATYEKVPPRTHHVGIFPALEDQQTTWTPESGPSPDRLDALVYVVSELFGSIPRQAEVVSAASSYAAEMRRRGIVGPGVGRIRRS